MGHRQERGGFGVSTLVSLPGSQIWVLWGLGKLVTFVKAQSRLPVPRVRFPRPWCLGLKQRGPMPLTPPAPRVTLLLWKPPRFSLHPQGPHISKSEGLFSDALSSLWTGLLVLELVSRSPGPTAFPPLPDTSPFDQEG